MPPMAASALFEGASASATVAAMNSERMAHEASRNTCLAIDSPSPSKPASRRAARHLPFSNYLRISDGFLGQRKELSNNPSLLDLLGKRPDTLDGLAQHPVQIVGVQELHLVSNHLERLFVGGDGFDDRPVRGPHQTLRTKRLVQALDEFLRVEPRVWLFG